MFEKLYENIGEKIKNLAKCLYVLEFILAVFLGIMFILEGELLYAFISFIIGPLIAIISTWPLYAFGDLVENTHKNQENTRNILNLLDQRIDEKAYKEEDDIVVSKKILQ